MAEELARCRSCNAPVRFVLTESGKLMPLDADPDGHSVGLLRIGKANVAIRNDRAHVLKADEPWDGDLYVSHFVTCPAARQWSKGPLRKAVDRAIGKVKQGL